MKPTIISAQQTKDLSHIKTSEDLQAEIRSLKASLKMKEYELEERWKQIPQQGLRKAAVTVLPKALNKTTAFNAWKLISGLIGIIVVLRRKNPFSTRPLKQTLSVSIKRLLVIMALRALSNWRKKRKTAKHTIQVS
ncbi:MAG: hypothetical protein ABJA79_08350 [Parafilimonas sp.]